ncbi:unnamed protein product, partial [Meganyctiphanes norvegica]
MEVDLGKIYGLNALRDGAVLFSKLCRNVECQIIFIFGEGWGCMSLLLSTPIYMMKLLKNINDKCFDILEPKESDVTTTSKAPKKKKNNVANKLEEQAESKKGRNFRLPKDKIRWITYMMDKYGDDYKAMARDPKNYFQDTWKQIRGKVRQFQSIPEQYAPYLKQRGLLTEEYIEKQKQEKPTCESDGEFDI